MSDEKAAARAEALFEKRARQASEGAQAMNDYHARQEAALKNMERLRALRMGQKANSDRKPPKRRGPTQPRAVLGSE